MVSNPRLQAIFYLMMVNALWGMSFPTVKGLNAQLDRQFIGLVALDEQSYRLASATLIVALRFSVALVLLLLLFRKLVFQTRGIEWMAGAVLGTFFLIGLILQTIGLASIPASRSGFLTSLSVVFTPILVAAVRGQFPSLRMIAGVGVATMGVAILTGLVQWDSDGLRVPDNALQVWTLGDTLTTVASIFFSMQIICIDQFGKRMNPAALTPGMFAAVSLLAIALFCCVVWRSDALPLSPFTKVLAQPSFGSLIVMLSIFPSLMAFSWMNTYQPRVSAIQAAVIYTMEPVFVATWALFLPGILSHICGGSYLNESITVSMILGGGLVLVANLLVMFPSKPAQ